MLGKQTQIYYTGEQYTHIQTHEYIPSHALKTTACEEVHITMIRTNDPKHKGQGRKGQSFK